MSDENEQFDNELSHEIINFNITDAALTKLAERHKDVDAYKDFEAAKAAATECQKLRKKLTEAHKFKKADALAFGRRLDAEKNRIMGLIEAVEEPIRTQLTEIKEKAEREESARVEKIEAEIERIKAFANDRHDLTVEQLEERRETLALIKIDGELFQELTDQANTFKDEADAKLRIALVNEQERVAEAEKLEAQRKEQAYKQKELDERQDKLDAEEADRKSEQAKRDQEAAGKLAEENAKRQYELDKQAEEQAAEQKKIDDENARITQEATDKEEAERKEQEEKEAAELAALQAPDIEKLDKLVEQIEAIAMPTVASQAAEDILTYVRSDIRELAKNIRHYAGEMK